MRSGEWETLDYLLILAYEYTERLRCPQCGGWIWDCSNEIPGNTLVTHRVREQICLKVRALESHRDSKRKSRSDSETVATWGVVESIESGIPRLIELDEATIEDYYEAVERRVPLIHTRANDAKYKELTASQKIVE